MSYILQVLKEGCTQDSAKGFMLPNGDTSKLEYRNTTAIKKCAEIYNANTNKPFNFYIFDTLDELLHNKVYINNMDRSSIFEHCAIQLQESAYKDSLELTLNDFVKTCKVTIDFDFKKDIDQAAFDKRYYYIEQMLRHLMQDSGTDSPSVELWKSDRGYHATFLASWATVKYLDRHVQGKGCKFTVDFFCGCGSNINQECFDIDVLYMHNIKKPHQELKQRYKLTLTELTPLAYDEHFEPTATLQDVFFKAKTKIANIPFNYEFKLERAATEQPQQIDNTVLERIKRVCQNCAKLIIDLSYKLRNGKQAEKEVIEKLERLDELFKRDFLGLMPYKKFFNYCVQELPENEGEEPLPQDDVYINILNNQNFSELLFLFHERLTEWELSCVQFNPYINFVEQITNLLLQLDYKSIKTFLEYPYILLSNMYVCNLQNKALPPIELSKFTNPKRFLDLNNILNVTRYVQDKEVRDVFNIERTIKAINTQIFNPAPLSRLIREYDDQEFAPYNYFLPQFKPYISDSTLNTYNPPYNKWLDRSDLSRNEQELADNLFNGFKDLLRLNLTNGEEQSYLDIWDMLCQWIQKPAALCNFLPCFIGGGGIGKSLFKSIYFEICGGYFTTISPAKTETVFGKFNTTLFENIYIFLEEMEPKNYKKDIENIKEQVGNDALKQCEGKNINSRNAKSYAKLMIASNHRDLFAPTKDERRLYACYCREVTDKDHSKDAAKVLAERVSLAYMAVKNSGTGTRHKIMNYLYCVMTNEKTSFNMQASSLPPHKQAMIEEYLADTIKNDLDLGKKVMLQIIEECEKGYCDLCANEQRYSHLPPISSILYQYRDPNKLAAEIKQELKGTYKDPRYCYFLAAFERKLNIELTTNKSYKDIVSIRKFYDAKDNPSFTLSNKQNVRLIGRMFSNFKFKEKIIPFVWSSNRIHRFMPEMEILKQYLNSTIY